MKLKKITKVSTSPKLHKKTRVSAYARVSSGKDAMLNSLSSQVNHYKRLIQSNPEWEYCGVYSDEAMTGTKDSRKEFQQLIEDCRNGKIDLIITKSISRFARNTVTLLETIRELQTLNVDVFFEEQKIHTISGEGEMILTFLATFAQEESRSVSENMKWRITKEFEKGNLWGGKEPYGYRIENKKYVLVPEEAEIVRSIFDLYIQGHGDLRISQILNEKGYRTKRADKWQWITVRTILNNYNYTGDLILQKTYRENHLTKLTKINKGEYNKYLIEDDHAPIITKEVFFAAQDIRKAKSRQIKISNKKVYFTGILKCGLCGKGYTFRKSKYNDNWICSTARQKGKHACSAKQVLDKKLIEAAEIVLEIDQFDEKVFRKKVDSIIVLQDNLLKFNFKDGVQKDCQWQYDARGSSWSDEMREQARLDASKRYKGGC